MLLEASKVRHYHSTLLEGIIRAHAAGASGVDPARPRLLAHRSLFDNLSADVRAAVDYKPIPVMDQDRRRLVRKSLLEAWVVLRTLARVRRDETLLVTTILPSAMILVELAARFFPHRRLIMLQHGELEGAFEKQRQRLGSFGFYILVWLRLRRWGTPTMVAVLDEFIADALRRHFPRSVRDEDMFVLPLPMTPVAPRAAHIADTPLRCCFIGFDTINKGFATFERLAAAHPENEYRVIGGGYDRALGEPGGRRLVSSDDFMAALSACDVAILPYTGGYSCSLSAAATDAVACGLQILASDRACFVALAETFDDAVTVCRDEAGMAEALGDPQWLERARDGQAKRVGRVAMSRYGRQGVARALEAMLVPEGARAATDERSDVAPQAIPAPRPRDHEADRELVAIPEKERL